MKPNQAMIIEIIKNVPCLYKKSYIEIYDGKRKFTKVVTHKEAEEILRDLEGIAKIIEL